MVEVAGYDEQREVICLPASTTALAVVDEFEQREEAGRLLNAVCLMGDGGRDVLGIATVYDVPALIKAAQPHRQLRSEDTHSKQADA